MATSVDYIEFVCSQIAGTGEIRYKKMFGEYMVYVNNKPVIIVCDNCAFVKKLDCLADIMASSETGFPYNNAKEHYILDIEDTELCREAVNALEKVTPVPKPRKKPVKK